MTDRKPFDERLNTWVQTVAILAAGIWAVYTFIYKEMTVPDTAPVNISAELTLSVGSEKARLAGGEDGMYLPVSLHISVKNSSSRQISLLPGVFAVYGKAIRGDKRRQLTAAASYRLDPSDTTLLERHIESVKTEMIATGRTLPDTFLKPGETTSKTVVIYVPADEYDVLDAVAIMPTTRDATKFTLEWAYNKNTDSVVPTLYAVKGAEKKLIKPSSASQYGDDAVQITAARYQVAVPNSNPNNR